MHRLLWLAATSAALGLSSTQAQAVHRYDVQVADSLDRLRVRACFEEAVPRALVAETSGARVFLEQVRLPDGERPKPAGEEMALEGLSAGACVEYRVRLEPARGGVQSGGPESRWVGRDLLTSIGDWLWRPPEGGDIELSFRLPDGVSVSAPWQRIADREGRPNFRLGPTPPTWPGVVAFGRFTQRTVTVAGATLHLAMLDGPPPEKRDWIEQWVRTAAANVATLHGRFPVDSVQVVVAPIARGRGPVPWAYVARGGGPALHFFINPSLPAAEFERDWTATHEMSHLFLPYLGTRDAWLAEGLPTYLQNVLMARGGAIDEPEMWKRMILGFQRGARVGPSLSLVRATERIGSGGLYQRVYWAGAALMLEADLRLRSASGGEQSLDRALQSLRECCLAQQDRRWSAAELAGELDRATGASVFADLLGARLEDPEFPDYRASLVRAGVTVVDGEVRLDPAAPWADVREALVRPPDK
jgi:hypothetical protein